MISLYTICAETKRQHIYQKSVVKRIMLRRISGKTKHPGERIRNQIILLIDRGVLIEDILRENRPRWFWTFGHIQQRPPDATSKKND